MKKIDNEKDLEATSGGSHWAYAHRCRDNDHLYRLDEDGVKILLENGYSVKRNVIAELTSTIVPGMKIDMPIYSITDTKGNNVTSDTLKELLGKPE